MSNFIEYGGKEGAAFWLRLHSLDNIHVALPSPEKCHCCTKDCSESLNLNISENACLVLEVCMASRRLSVIPILSKVQNIPNSGYIIYM